ncbi:MAG TPA: zf-HC2 domain-containing protein, partial [Vicinamibacterales bacterium]|nr:zf-HC2 domain-containing protein [Vicinamibacterales bacterium]
MTKSLDRLLREALRERTAPNLSGPCLDAETVAGWFDGTLGARDRAAAEAHAADCARCQALLA